jgi:hypothetical protein
MRLLSPSLAGHCLKTLNVLVQAQPSLPSNSFPPENLCIDPRTSLTSASHQPLQVQAISVLGPAPTLAVGFQKHLISQVEKKAC